LGKRVKENGLEKEISVNPENLTDWGKSKERENYLGKSQKRINFSLPTKPISIFGNCP
jgi:hypothetical protein